jgi:hypothetical protein
VHKSLDELGTNIDEMLIWSLASALIPKANEDMSNPGDSVVHSRWHLEILVTI